MKPIVGLTAVLERWPADVEALVAAALVEQRLVFTCTDTQLKGSRYLDTQKIIAAATGTYTAEEVMQDPVSVARAGLDWAADTDFWYATEKDWGRDEE